MQVIILMGVSGVGKTTIGKMLSEEMRLPFFDADDFHPSENIRKMEKGIALLDKDRMSWLEVLALKIREWERSTGAILACSALREGYRTHLQSYAEKKLTWIFLHADYDIILERLKARKNHYFKPELLLSQYEALQEPDYGVHVDVNLSKEIVVERILEKLKENEPTSQLGLVGLGVMGKSLALNLAEKGFRVSVFNRHVVDKEVDIAKKFAEAHSEFKLLWFDQLEPFVASIKAPRNILLMVNAGPAVDAVIEGLQPFLEPGDLIIDGGNSHYKDTVRREMELKDQKILFMGAGISGGEEGALKGPSIMPGGPKPAYEMAGGFLKAIAAKDKKGNPCCTYVGPDGAGHFVKMLHNGIEYGEMQLIAEFYHYLRFFGKKASEEIADIFEDWNGSMKSYLLEISIDILRKKEDGDHLIDKILDAAKQKGTGGWSTNAALELGVAFDTITASVMARNMSARKEERKEAADLYKTGKTNGKGENLDLQDLFKAYQAGSIINHAIGFDLLLEASKTYEWKLNLSEIARIWTNGCIIRSGFMEDLIELLKESPSTNILLNDSIVSELSVLKSSMLNTLAEALEKGCPMQVLSAAANYFLSYTSAQSSANMIQAQRDYFGAHTYERTDKARGEFFHTKWVTGE